MSTTITTWTRGAALAAFAVLGGCDDSGEYASDPDGWEFPGHGGKDDSASGGLVATTETNARVFQGFSVVTDSAVGSSCVVPRSGAVEFAAFRAGGDVSEETMTYVESLEELHEALDINATAQVKAGPLSGGASVGFAEEFKSTESSLAILVRSKHAYTVINQDEHVLTDEAQLLAETDPEAFVRKCGTHYVAGVEYGAELRLLIQIETNSKQDKEELKTELETNGIKAGAATIGGGISTKLSKALSEKGATVTARVETLGFTSDVSLAGLEANPLDPTAMELAKQATSQLRESVALDKCHDQGESAPGGKCAGNAARGYLANGARTATPTAIALNPYRLTTNFPTDPASTEAFLLQQQKADRALDHIEEHATLFNTLVRIYNDEVGALLASSTPYDFAVYDPDEVFLAGEGEGLRDYALNMEKAFHPETGHLVQLLADSLAPCWDRALFNDFSSCQQDARSTDRFQSYLAAVNAYGAQRIRQVYYDVFEETSEWDEAVDHCDKGWRLPDKYEATRLLAALRTNPNIPTPRFTADNLEGDHAMWVNDEHADCGQDEGAYVDFDLAADKVFVGCYENPWDRTDMELPVLCVPTAGPYGSDVPAL